MPCAYATLAHSASAQTSARNLLALFMIVPRLLRRGLLRIHRRRRLARRVWRFSFGRGVLVPFLDRYPFVVVALPTPEILEKREVRRRRVSRRGPRKCRARRRRLRGRRLACGPAHEAERADQGRGDSPHQPTPSPFAEGGTKSGW